MPNTTTLNETLRTVDGTEWIRVATPGANWRQQLSTIIAGNQANSVLTLQSTSGVGTSDSIQFKTGSQINSFQIDTGQSVTVTGGAGFGNGVQAQRSFGGAVTPMQIQRQFNTGNPNVWTLELYGWGNTAQGGGAMAFGTSRASTSTGLGAVQNGDALGTIWNYADDGVTTNLVSTGGFSWFVDGTVGTNSIPMSLKYTTNTFGEMLRLDSSGFLLMRGNNTTSFSGGLTGAPGAAWFTILSDGTVTNAINIQAINANAGGGTINFSKTRGQANTNTATSSGDVVGIFNFFANDGTAFRNTATIKAVVDGTVSSGTAPQRIVLSTGPTNSASIVERLRIDSSGNITNGGQTTAGAVFNNIPSVLINSTTAGQIQVGLTTWAASASGGGSISLAASRGASVATYTAVQSGDRLGVVWFGGVENSNASIQNSAAVSCFCDAAPGTNSTPGRLEFSTTPSGSQFGTTRLIIDNKGNIVQGASGLATNATDGFLYIESCAGTPTGTPTSYSGRQPTVVDTTNDILYYYNSGWKPAVLANSWTDNSSPTITAQSGTFTTVSGDLRIKQVGKTAFVACNVTITTVGTGSGYIQVALPFTVVNSGVADFPASAIDRSANTQAMFAYFVGATAAIRFGPSSGGIQAHSYSFCGVVETA